MVEAENSRGTTQSGNTASRTLPDLPTFEQQSAGTSSGVSWLSTHTDPSDPLLAGSATTAFNPAARLRPTLVAKIEFLEFVEMNELLIEAWSTSEGSPADHDQGLFGKLSRRALVTDFAIWTECFCLMAAVLSCRFPAKAPACLRTCRGRSAPSMARRGSHTIAYSGVKLQPTKVWTGPSRTKPSIMRPSQGACYKATTWCKHCLSDAHSPDLCPDVPWTPKMWPFIPSQALNAVRQHSAPTDGDKETCCRFNEEYCFVQRCKYRHNCSICAEGHPAARCSKHRSPTGQGSLHPYHLRNSKEPPAS